MSDTYNEVEYEVRYINSEGEAKVSGLTTMKVITSITV